MTRIVSGCFSQSGFSLHQALVSLAIASVLGVLTIPNVKPALANQRMATSVNTLVTALQLTRSEAIHHGERAVLCPTLDNIECIDSHSDWHQGFMVYIDQNANRQRDDDEPVVRTFQVSRNIELRSSRGRDHITYQASGLAYGSNATFTFCDASKYAKARAVIVSNSGRPRVQPARDSRLCG